MHVPVLLQEIVENLRPQSGKVYVDGTLGAAGYSIAILDASQPDGMVIGFDVDLKAVEAAKSRMTEYGERFKAIHGGYHEAKALLAQLNIAGVDGIVLDLGLSSDQLDDPDRGFSFRFDAPLDMRFDTSSESGALELLQQYDQKKLEEILARYGEERYCKRLARSILQALGEGHLNSTKDLATLIEKSTPGPRGKIHPATRTFQALRIAVNRELEHLEQGLKDLPTLLNPGGRMCVVSYHSLEDRAVKLSFRGSAKQSKGFRVVTKKIITAGPTEKRENPRARSAKLRVLEAVDVSELCAEDSGYRSKARRRRSQRDEP